MKHVIQRWFAKGSKPSSGRMKAGTKTLLKGGVDLISPSLISGWAWHPEFELHDVRLLSGTRLIATARLDVHRADVEEKVGSKGNHAFNLKIPTDVLPIDLTQELRLLALTADGSERFPLFCMKDNLLTQTQLKTALDPTYFGMQGHFDGMTSDGLSVSGWCFQGLRPHEVCTVYLRIEGMEPIPIRCEQCRPGFSALGYPEYCGFGLRLDDLNIAADSYGKSMTVSFDEKGLLPLPQAVRCFLPQQPAADEVSPSVTSLDPPEDVKNDTGLQVRAPLAYPVSQDFARYWSELEDFKRLCDVFERELILRIQNEEYAQSVKTKRMRGWSKMFGRRT